MSIVDQLSAAYPGIRFGIGGDCRLEDDGGGVRIAYWRRSEPKPDLATLPTPPVSFYLAPLLAKIDSDVDTVYSIVIGQRAVEYQEAEEDAGAYKAAGYTGTVPPSVASWVAASGMTARAAADDILATAAAWRGAALQMRSARLSYKAQARAAATTQALATVETSWRATINAIRAALGLAAV